MDERAVDRSPALLVAYASQRAFSRWPLALALYLPNLILGLASAAVVYRAGLTLETIGPWTTRLAEGDLVNTALELTSALASGPSPAVSAFGADMASAAQTLLLGLVLHGIIYNLLAGAVLARLAGRGMSFAAALRRWLGPMLLFGLVALAAFLLLGVLGLIVVLLLPLGGSANGVVVQVLLALAWLAVVNGLLELTRANMIEYDQPNPAAALGRSLRAIFRPQFLGVALPLWLGLALLGALYVALTGGLNAAMPAALLLPAIVVQQLLAFLGAWLKLLRLAAALGLARAVV